MLDLQYILGTTLNSHSIVAHCDIPIVYPLSAQSIKVLINRNGVSPVYACLSIRKIVHVYSWIPGLDMERFWLHCHDRDFSHK